MSEDDKSADRMRACAISMAATMETRKIPRNEAPVILGMLVASLAKQINMPLEMIVGMVTKSAEATYQNTP